MLLRAVQCCQVEVTVDAAELAAGFDHAGGAAAPCSRSASSSRCGSWYARSRSSTRSRWSSAASAPTTRRHVQPQHGERLLQPFPQRPGRARVGPLELAGEGFELGRSGQRGVGVVGPSHPFADHLGSVQDRSEWPTRAQTNPEKLITPIASQEAFRISHVVIQYRQWRQQSRPSPRSSSWT